MADRLAVFPETRAKPVTPKYPWFNWMDGSPWRITRNRDFVVDTKDMATLLYNKAKRACKGNKVVKVRVTKMSPDILVFQFYDPGKQVEGLHGAQGR